MHQRVGTCSLCGGDVYGHRGAWMSVTPPPVDTCSACGAVAAADVIEMRRPSQRTVVEESPSSGTWKITCNERGEWNYVRVVDSSEVARIPVCIF